MECAAPLEGLRVLDFTQVAAGPVCTMMLGDMGADVIKVEPPSGDLARKLGPPWQRGESVAYLSLNRNKRGLVVDLKKPGAVELIRRLARRCDVAVESFRPGVADRLGIGYEALKAENPGIVYCSVSAYGQTGPWAGKPGVDGILQGSSGLMSIIGTPGAPPCKVQTPVVDMATGYLAAMAVLAALRARDRTGRGQHLDVGMYGSALMLQQLSFAAYLASGEVPERIGSAAPYAAPNEAFPTSDGWIMVAAYHPERWRALCRLMGRADLAEDPRFADGDSRVRHRPELVEILSETFRQRTSAEWLEALERADILCGPIATYDQVEKSPQLQHAGMVVETDHPVAGRLSMPGFCIGFSETPGGVRHAAPAPGQHTAELLASFDFRQEEIAELLRLGVVAQWELTS